MRLGTRLTFGVFTGAILFAASMACTGSGAEAKDADLASVERVEAMAAPIKSKEQLYSYLAASTDSPLSKLSPTKQQSFIDSLVFTSTGLGSFSYLELEGLPSSDVYRILTLFGAQHYTGSIDRRISDGDRDVEQVLLRSARPDKYYNMVCVVYPNGKSACKQEHGSYCIKGCGGNSFSW